MTNRKQQMAWALTVITAMLLLNGCAERNDPPTTNPVQSMAPDQFVRLISNEAFSGLVVVFATWCPPCRQELPEVAEVWRAHPSKGVQIIAVSVDDGDVKKVQRLVNQLQLPFPVYHGGMRIAADLGIIGVPSILVVNKGKVVENSPGQQTSQSLNAKLERLRSTAPH